MTIYYYSSDNTTLVGYHIQGLASIFSYFILYPGKIPSENSRIYSISLKFEIFCILLYYMNQIGRLAKQNERFMVSYILNLKMNTILIVFQ